MDSNPSLAQSEPTPQPQEPPQAAPWQVPVDSPQRYPTPSAIEASEPPQTYSSVSDPPYSSTTQSASSSLPPISNVPLPDNQNFHVPAPFPPIFAVSSASYESRVEDYQGLVSSSLQNLTLPGTSPMTTLHHLQQVLQQAGDRKGLPPHVQVVPLFDPSSGLGALSRNLAMGPVSVPGGLGSVPAGLGNIPGLGSLPLGSLGSSGTTSSITMTSGLHTMTPPVMSLTTAPLPDSRDHLVSTLEARDQLVSEPRETLTASHSALLSEQSQSNPTSLHNPTLFPMVQLGGSYRSGEAGTDPTPLIITDPDPDHAMLALSDVTRKQITETFSVAAAEGHHGTTHSPSYPHIPPRHYTESSDAYQPQPTADHGQSLGMASSLDDRIDATLHHPPPPDGSSVITNTMSVGVNGTLANERLLSGSHNTSADLSASGIMPGSANDLHIIEPQSMLGLNERALHDPMVTQQTESSDDEDLVKPMSLHSANIHSYDSAHMFMSQPRKSQRIADRDRTPSPPHKPFYIPKQYYSITEIWCEDCQTCYTEECNKHHQIPMYDKVVLSRAWATLPSSLQIFRLGDTTELGVFARKGIPKRSKFGPFYAPLVETPDQVTNKRFLLKLENEDGCQYFLEPSDENNCNWMMFVRPAETYAEQNVVAYQYKMDVFYLTTKHIEPKQELKVWYAAPYAARMGVQPHRPTEEELQAALVSQNKWPCYECDRSFRTSALLQKHLIDHEEPTLADTFDDDIDDNEENMEEKFNQKAKKKTSKPRATKGKTKKIKELVGEENTVFQSWKKRKTNMYLNKIKKYREPIKRSLMTLYKRQGKDSGGNEWICTHCDLTFDNPSLLNLHTLTHAAEDLAMVDLNSTLAASVLPGLDTEHSTDMVLNADGGIIPGGAESLPSVIQWDENHLQCPVCDIVFQTKQELILHASEHARRGRRPVRIHPRKPFKCLTCWKCFTSDERLQKHMLCHNEKTYKPYECLSCNKRFMNNSALACHLKTHSDKKYYECPMCDAGFDQIHAMKDHIQTHSNNGMFDCLECHKSFPEFNLIRRHMKAFHSTKRYSCMECGKEFSRPDKLKLHMLKHSNHREYMCETCGRQFKRKDKLGEHIKRMHNPTRKKKKVPTATLR